MWDYTLEHVLVVERIENDEATIIYAFGDAPTWRIYGGGFYRVKGTFKNRVLVIKLPRPATVTYNMRPDGKISAKYEWQGGTSWATMTKMP